jgi:hypothetical protein
MKTIFNISESETGGEGCNGVSITVQTEDYHRDSTAIYNKVIDVLSELLPALSGFKDSEGKEMAKVELEIRDYSEREYPNGMPRVITLQDHTIYEAGNKA